MQTAHDHRRTTSKLRSRPRRIDRRHDPSPRTRQRLLGPPTIRTVHQDPHKPEPTRRKLPHRPRNHISHTSRIPPPQVVVAEPEVQPDHTVLRHHLRTIQQQRRITGHRHLKTRIRQQLRTPRPPHRDHPKPRQQRNPAPQLIRPRRILRSRVRRVLDPCADGVAAARCGQLQAAGHERTEIACAQEGSAADHLRAAPQQPVTTRHHRTQPLPRQHRKIHKPRARQLRTHRVINRVITQIAPTMPPQITHQGTHSGGGRTIVGCPVQAHENSLAFGLNCSSKRCAPSVALADGRADEGSNGTPPRGLRPSSVILVVSGRPTKRRVCRVDASLPENNRCGGRPRSGSPRLRRTDSTTSKFHMLEEF
ncbi:hypothetical protein MSMEI_4621 [Mycolicibacterium smegmatis MC2 155]|uniref:Uncharacterized protein n=1 Tax=Mycolicibacterium smegmatis (strain ATCC 700084 / mc(2)155) TaxID=246196 RepID=I7GCT8_MYCS2|nr:hypothetical protein MSMEI_4621 [Mycolicibacterium smegmatis MC2 155]